jgi:hypothetical protein
MKPISKLLVEPKEENVMLKCDGVFIKTTAAIIKTLQETLFSPQRIFSCDQGSGLGQMGYNHFLIVLK